MEMISGDINNSKWERKYGKLTMEEIKAEYLELVKDENGKID